MQGIIMASHWIILSLLTWFRYGECQQINIGVIGDVWLEQEVTAALSELNDVSYVPLNMVMVEVADSEDAYINAYDVCRVISQEAVALGIISGSCRTLPLISSLLSHAQVPHIALARRECTLWSAISTNITYDLDKPGVAYVLVEIVRRLQWKHLVIFHDNHNAVAQQVSSLLQTFGNRNMTVTLYELPRLTENINRLLQRVQTDKYHSKPFLVLASDKSIETLLTKADELDMRRGDYRWLVYGSPSASESLKEVLGRGDNIALLEDYGHDYLQLALSSYIQQTLQQINQTLEDVSADVQYEATWARNHSEVGLCSNPYSERLRMKIRRRLEENMQNVEPLNCTFPLYKVVSSVAREDSFEFDTVGVWDSDGKLQIVDDTVYPNTNYGFNRRTFRVTSLEYSFFQRKVPTGNATFRWEGLSFQLLDELAEELNFTYKVVEPTDGMWGIGDENGVWNGMIAQVMNEEVDFAAAGFSVTGPRESVIDFSQPYFHEQSAVVIKRPDNSSRLLLFLKPFRWEVWLGCIAATVLCGLLLWLFSAYSPHYSTRRGAAVLGTSPHVSCGWLSNAMLYTYGAFVQQGGVWLPSSQSGRILVGCFWFFSIVIVATYTGNLIAFLAVNVVDLPFNSLRQMVQQSEMPWGTAEGVALVMLFRDANFEPYTSVHDKMDLVSNYTEGLRRIKEGKYAFIAEKSWYQGQVAKDCSLAMIKETFYPTNYAWAFHEGSPIVQVFNDRINKLREAGVLNYWIKKWTPKALNCTGLRPVTNAKVADLVDFQGALYIFATGITIAAMTLIGERCTYLAFNRSTIDWKNVLPHGRTDQYLNNRAKQIANGELANGNGQANGDLHVNNVFVVDKDIERFSSKFDRRRSVLKLEPSLKLRSRSNSVSEQSNSHGNTNTISTDL